MKILGIVLLCFLLFILLCVFGLAFSIHQIALSPSFATGIINDIDFSKTTRDALEYEQAQNIGEDLSQELIDTIVNTVDEIEPVIKESANIAIRDTYDYVLGKADAPDFKETLSDSFMNTQFVDSLLAGTDFSQIVDAAMKEQTATGDVIEDSVQKSLLNTLDNLEPTIKQGVVSASGPVFKYLLGETQTINLKTILRQNIIDKEFVTEMVNSLDIETITKDLIGNQLDMILPQGITLNSDEVDQVIAAIEPSIKAGMIAAADSIADYLVSIRQDFSITISWDTASASAKSIVKQAFLRQLPSSLANATQAQIDQAYEIYWASARSSIPTTFNIDASVLGENLSQSISDGFTSAQNGLADARNGINDAATNLAEVRNEIRPYVTLAQSLFWSLILLILLTIGGIILIHRSVKGATRDLGITFLVYGGITLIGVLILKSTIGRPEFVQRFISSDTPEYALNIISSVIQRLTQPLFIFTLACTILGAGLLTVFFVYLRRGAQAPANQTTAQSA